MQNKGLVDLRVGLAQVSLACLLQDSDDLEIHLRTHGDFLVRDIRWPLSGALEHASAAVRRMLVNWFTPFAERVILPRLAVDPGRVPRSAGSLCRAGRSVALARRPAPRAGSTMAGFLASLP